MNHEPRIIDLQANASPVLPQDSMPEAGRKVLLNDFIQMLQHEAGSISGGDIEDLHDMRVASRRIRSTFRLLGHYYKPKVVERHLSQLRKVARALGDVRDLDVMLEDMLKFQTTLPESDQVTFQDVMNVWHAERTDARETLIRALGRKSYQRFVDDFFDFVIKPGAGVAKGDDDALTPYQVRHVLPGIIHEQLAIVRAYDNVLDGAKDETLHALRIEFKRLRYAVTLFREVLGPEIDGYIPDLKAMQDHLGRLQDTAVMQERLDDKKYKGDNAALNQYLEALKAEADELRESFPAMWRHFNTKTVQRKLALALASLN